MITEDQVRDVIGATAHGSSGEKIGKVGQVYLDDEVGRPEWLTVSTGMFGTKESFVPVQEARLDDGTVTVPYDKLMIKDAPNVDPDGGHLSEQDEAELYRYYGMSQATMEPGRESVVPEGVSDIDERRGPVGEDVSGPTTDDAMTRSEERMRVGTERREAGRARLRKYVVTEDVQTTVPVSHEEVRVEREPITEANRSAATSGPAISEEEHEVTLHEERPVVETEAVPVERVRMEPETVTDEETVSGQVRKEEIDVEGGRNRDR